MVHSTEAPRWILGIADEQDRKRIYQMRHSVYAEELGQHATNEAGSLKDGLDDFNTYLVARQGDKLAGFVSITPPGAPSFSVDKYFDRQLIPVAFDAQLFEVRLLTVDKALRNTSLALLLMYAAMRWVEAQGGSTVIAICRKDLLKMYVAAGLSPLQQEARSGNVEYVLSAASISRLNDAAREKAGAIGALQKATDWRFRFPFYAPAPCYHGGAFFEAIGEDLQTLDKKEEVINADVLDAPFPPSPKVLAALQAHLPWLLQTSPPTHSAGLVDAIASARGVPKASVLPGAGSSDLIFLALQALLKPASKVLILDPCYGEYRHVLDHLVRCRVTTFPLQRADGFAVNTDALLQEIKQGYDMVVLVNPNSPTGLHVGKETMLRMLRKVPADTLVWIDETYIEYAGSAASLEQYAAQSENVIVCKSMSKVYALSGVRAAYLCAPLPLLETLKSLTPPWAVSLPAQLAAITALSDDEYYSEKYAEVHAARKKLRRWLLQLGMAEIVPGIANFLLFYLPVPIAHLAGPFVESCRRRGLFIRDAGNMGHTLGPGALRIAVKDAATNARMLSIMEGAVAETILKSGINSPLPDAE